MRDAAVADDADTDDDVGADADVGSEDLMGACDSDDCSPAGPGVTLVPVEPPIDHVFAFDPLDDPLAIGPGGALLDADGDGDTDVFLGDSEGGSSPCLYLNESTPGHLAFAADPTVCGTRWLRRVFTGVGLDTDGDGAEELLVGGSRFLAWAPDDPQTGTGNLLDELLARDDDRRRCNVSALVPVDLDLDGTLEIYVACGHAAATAGAPVNLIFEPDPDAPRFWTAEESALLANDGRTLAVAVLDIDGDGLLDLALADDTLSGPGVRNVADEPGGALLRTDPLDATWSLHRYADDATAWGSYMGFGVVTPAGGAFGPSLYITDRGPNRVFRWADDAFSQDTDDPWIEASLAAGPGNDDLFAWGAVTADFDGDGDRDLYVTQGDVWPDRIEHGVDVGHEDHLILFDGGGPATGLPRSAVAPGDRDFRRNVRSAAGLDLDGDGRLELLTVPLTGSPRFDRVVPEGDIAVCTVRPTPTVVPSRALGYAYRLGDAWWPAEIEGRTRLGGPRVLTLPATADRLRFPSGWETALDCPPGGGVEQIAEAAWLTVSAGATQVRVDGPDDLEVHLVSGAGERVVGPGTYEIDAPRTVVIRANGRWVSRVWRSEPE